MARAKKRNRKFLGSRSHGKGNAKNRRGKGNKGGWGRAGMHKHRFTYITAYEPDFFGVHGFSPVRRKRMRTINLWEIEQLARKGKLEVREGKPYFEFDGKVLGCGSISTPVCIKALAFSSGAKAKIEKAGGSAEAPPATSAGKREGSAQQPS
ncbi:MAG: 50S ribosomal protein L15 [Candidatus Micrarchaeota archaeon]|nr:50S ribosomal protein L15 [Candidatus Micrarchaeota archaeon]